MNSLKTNPEKIYILFSNLEKGFLCDYIEQTAKILAKKNFIIVAYYTRPYALGDLIKDRRKLRRILKQWLKIVFSNQMGIYECEFISLLPFQRFGFIYKINRRLTAIELRLILFLRKLFEKKNFRVILWIFNPTAEFFVNKLGEKISLYDCVDYLEEIKGGEEKIHHLENKLLKKVDWVFVISPVLREKIKKVRNDVKLVPCGCAIEVFPFRFKPKTKPLLLTKIAKPIVGFFGHLDYRLDYSLIEKLVKNNSDLSFVFIGRVLDKVPVITYRQETDSHNLNLELVTVKGLNRVEADRDENSKRRKTGFYIKKLKRYSNFFLLPAIRKKEIKNYLYFFDIVLIPYQLKHKVVFYSNPMKFYEYLAMGKPVVSSPIPALLKYNLPIVKFAKEEQEFSAAIKFFINHPEIVNQYKRAARKIAQANRWEKKVDKILKVINCC